MAGCCVAVVLFFGVAVMLAAAAIFLGIAFGALLAAVISTVLFFCLTRRGFFRKAQDAEEPLQRYGGKLLKILLIVVMIAAWLSTIGCIVLVCFLH